MSINKLLQFRFQHSKSRVFLLRTIPLSTSYCVEKSRVFLLHTIPLVVGCFCYAKNKFTITLST